MGRVTSQTASDVIEVPFAESAGPTDLMVWSEAQQAARKLRPELLGIVDNNPQQGIKTLAAGPDMLFASFSEPAHELGNGNVVLVAGNSYRIQTKDGVLVASGTVLAGATTLASFVTDTGFAVISHDPGTDSMRMTRISNAAAVEAANIALGFGAGITTSQYVRALSLSENTFALAYGGPTIPGGIRVINAAGATIHGAVSLHSGLNSYPVAMLKMPNGNLGLLVYKQQAGLQGPRLIGFSATLTTVGVYDAGDADIQGGVNQGRHNLVCTSDNTLAALTFLSAGMSVIALPATGGGYSVLIDNVNISSNNRGFIAADGARIFTYRLLSVTESEVTRVVAPGRILDQRRFAHSSLVEAGLVSSSSSYARLFQRGLAGFVLFVAGSGSGPPLAGLLFVSADLRVSQFIRTSTASSGSTVGCSLALSDGSIGINVGNWKRFSIDRASILGVPEGTVSAGSVGTVRVRGSIPIADTSVSLVASDEFPVGARGSVHNGRAMLLGL